MHAGLSEEQRRQIEQMRRSAGKQTYRKTTEKKKDFFEQTEELPEPGSSFFARLLAAMLLFALFLQFHLSGSTFLGHKSQEAVTAVSQNVDLQKVADSVRIKK